MANYSLYEINMIQLSSITAILQDSSNSILKYFRPDNSLLQKGVPCISSIPGLFSQKMPRAPPHQGMTNHPDINKCPLLFNIAKTVLDYHCNVGMRKLKYCPILTLLEKKPGNLYFDIKSNVQILTTNFQVKTEQNTVLSNITVGFFFLSQCSGCQFDTHEHRNR